MSVSRALSRLLRVSALTCAAALSCLSTCSASPVLTQVDNGVKHSILGSLYAPHGQNPILPAAPPPPEPGAKAGTHSETRTSGGALSIIDQRSSRQQFSYDVNSPHNKPPATAATDVWRGHGAARSAGGAVARRRSDGTAPRGNRRAGNTNAHYDHPPERLVRKSPQAESGDPVYVFSQIWPLEKEPHNQVKYPGVFSLKTTGDEKCWTYADVAFFSRLNGGYWTTVLLTPRGCYAGYEEGGELTAGRVQSTPLVSQSSDASVIKSSPSPEKPTASLTGFAQGMNSGRGSETQTQWASAVRGYSSISSSLIRFQQSPGRAVLLDGGQPHRRAQTLTSTTHPPATTISPAAPAPSQLSSLPASDKALEGPAPVHREGSQDSDGPGSEQPAVGRSVSKDTGGSAHDHKAAQATKRLYGFRGFENPMRRAGTEPPVPSKRHKKLNAFKTANAFLSKSPKYSSQEASTTAATQAKPEMTPTHSSSAPPGSHTAITAPGSQVWTESETGFGRRPHEGADALVREPDKSAMLQQDFEGSELKRSQLWQPRGLTVRTWYDRDASQTPALSQTKPRGEDFNSHLKAAGSVGSVGPSRFSPDEFKMHQQSDAFLEVQPPRNSRAQAEPNPSTQPPAPRVCSACLTPAGGLTVEPSLKSEPESEPAAARPRPVSTPTSSIARGTRVKGRRRENLYRSTSLSSNPAGVAIDRLPKPPISVTYADIVGSASFSRVGEDDFSYVTATESSETTSGRPEANAGDDGGKETLDNASNGERGGNRLVSHVLWPYFTTS